MKNKVSLLFLISFLCTGYSYVVVFSRRRILYQHGLSLSLAASLRRPQKKKRSDEQISRDERRGATAPIKAQWADGQSHHSIVACLLSRFANHLPVDQDLIMFKVRLRKIQV